MMMFMITFVSVIKSMMIMIKYLITGTHKG